MLNPQIIDYVSKSKAEGKTLEQIKSELISSGWTTDQAEQINLLFAPQSFDPPISEASPANAPSPTSSPHKPKRKTLVFVSLFLVLLLLILSVPSYLIAYGKITLPNPQLNSRIKTAIFSLPFLPKSPEIILTLSQEVMSKNKTADFDFSIALSGLSSQLSDALGSSNFDLSFTGSMSGLDTENPETQMLAKANNDTEVEFVLLNDMQYFKINKYPLALVPVFSIFGVTPEVFQKSLVSQWLSFDVSTLETPARLQLESMPTPTPTSKDMELQKNLERIFTQRILPKTILTNETTDGDPTFKLSFSPDPDTLDILAQEIETAISSNAPAAIGDTLTKTADDHNLSQYLKNTQVDLYIHSQTYQLIRLAVSFDLDLSSLQESEDPTLNLSTIRVVSLLKFSNFNSPKQITPPSSSRPAQEAIEELFSQAGESGLNPVRQLSMAENAKRKSDLATYLNAVEAKTVSEGKLTEKVTSSPQFISSTGADICSLLVPEYLSSLPVDPTIKEGQPITNCSADYNTGYQVQVNPARTQLTLSAPFADLGENIVITR